MQMEVMSHTIKRVLTRTDFIFLMNSQLKNMQRVENTNYATESRDFLLNFMEEVRIEQ